MFGEDEQKTRRAIVLVNHARQLDLESDDPPDRDVWHQRRAFGDAEKLIGPQAVVDQPVTDARLREHPPREVGVVHTRSRLEHRVDARSAAVEARELADAATKAQRVAPEAPMLLGVVRLAKVGLQRRLPPGALTKQRMRVMVVQRD